MNSKKAPRDESQAKESGEKKKYYPSLHPIEVLICIFLWGGGVVGSISTLVPMSKVNEQRYYDAGYLHEGWRHWLGRFQDLSDSEWSLWKKYLWEGTIPGYIGHFLVARIAEKAWPNRRFEIFLSYSFAFTSYFLGLQGILVFLFHFTVQYLAVVITRSVTVCWIVGLALLYILHERKCSDFVVSLYGEEVEKGYFLLVAVGMCNLRYIGFSLEYAWRHKSRDKSGITELTNTDKKLKPVGIKRAKSSKENVAASETIPKEDFESDFTFIDLLIYQMYFPLFFGGPIINYDEFARQIKKPPAEWTKDRALRFIYGMIRYIFWHIFTDIALHYIYVSALAYDKKTVLKMGMFELCGLSMAQVGLFYLKYLIWYGVPSHFSTSDGLDVPGQPQCVYSKHRMTDFWKLIDKGLHKWLVRYIYIPCGGSKSGVLRGIFSLTVSFTFVTLWHSPTHAHIWWGFGCWLGVLVEHIALGFYRTKQVRDFESRYIAPTWSRRIRAFFSCFAFGFLIVINLYFLGGLRLGNIYWKRFYYENVYATILIHVSLYGASQSSMNFE